jgi:hypothetical protein
MWGGGKPHIFGGLSQAPGAGQTSKTHPNKSARLPSGTQPYESIRFGAMDVTIPYEFIGFGAMDVTKPYEFIGFGAMVWCVPPVRKGHTNPNLGIEQTPNPPGFLHPPTLAY